MFTNQYAATVDYTTFNMLIGQLTIEKGRKARDVLHQKELKNEFIRVARMIDAGGNKEENIRNLREFLYQKAQENPFFDVDAMTSNGNVLKNFRITVSDEFTKAFAKYFPDNHGLKIILENLHHAVDKQSDEAIERLCQRVRVSLNQYLTSDPVMSAQRVDWLRQSLLKIPDDYRAMLIFLEREKEPQGAVLLLKEKMVDIDEGKKRRSARKSSPEEALPKKRKSSSSTPGLFEKKSSETLIMQLLAALKTSDAEVQPVLLVVESIHNGKNPDLEMLKNFIAAYQGLPDGDLKEMVRAISFPNTSVLERTAVLTPYYATMLINSIDRNQSKPSITFEEKIEKQQHSA